MVQWQSHESIVRENTEDINLWDEIEIYMLKNITATPRG